jgi:hypothetical protein
MLARHYDLLPGVEYGVLSAHPDRGNRSVYKVVARPNVGESATPEGWR